MRKALLHGRTRQAGVAAVEFAIVLIIFLTFIFATLELARLEFLFNTLNEVTRRAASGAANTSFKDADALQAVQADAVFRSTPGPLALGDPVTASHVKIDYLSVSKATWDLKHMSALPSCPARNRLICMNDPHADNCIRFVRARVCASMDSAGNCDRLNYQRVFPFLNLPWMKLPTAETIVPAGSLGFRVGDMPCP